MAAAEWSGVRNGGVVMVRVFPRLGKDMRVQMLCKQWALALVLGLASIPIQVRAAQLDVDRITSDVVSEIAIDRSGNSPNKSNRLIKRYGDIKVIFDHSEENEELFYILSNYISPFFLQFETIINRKIILSYRYRSDRSYNFFVVYEESADGFSKDIRGYALDYWGERIDDYQIKSMFDNYCASIDDLGPVDGVDGYWIKKSLIILFTSHKKHTLKNAEICLKKAILQSLGLYGITNNYESIRSLENPRDNLSKNDRIVLNFLYRNDIPSGKVIDDLFMNTKK